MKRDFLKYSLIYLPTFLTCINTTMGTIDNPIERKCSALKSIESEIMKPGQINYFHVRVTNPGGSDDTCSITVQQVNFFEQDNYSILAYSDSNFTDLIGDSFTSFLGETTFDFLFAYDGRAWICVPFMLFLGNNRAYYPYFF